MSAAASTPQGWTSGLLLSTTATPSKYDVALAPDLVKFTFQGQVRIDLVVNQPTNELVAHSFELAYAAGRSFLFAQGAKTEPLQTATSIELDEASQRVRFVFAQTIQPGSYTLSSVFTGILNDQLCGFYRSAYTSARTGKPAFMAVTQFEATDCRRALPCWDEPALKAVFAVTLIVDPTQVSLSNMPVIRSQTILQTAEEQQKDAACREIVVPRGYIRYEYADSPVMSSYLLAFIVGEFDYISKFCHSKDVPGATPVELRIYCPVGETVLGEFALDVAGKCLKLYEEFFQVPYPLPKLDLIAVPDFASGAMENWGCVTYRDTMLLIDPANSSALIKQRCAKTIAHEIAHMWFGNLCTMQWWSALWLNEGFARYCLAVGTSVAKFDGTHVPVEDLRVGDLLVSQDREPTTITAIYKDVSPSMIKITYMDGSHVVTPNHLVTLRWGGNPHVQPVVVGTSWSLLRIDWYDRDTLAKKEQYFRYVLPEQPLPNRSNGEATVFDTVDDAIDAAIFDGDKLIYEGVWERGTMTDAVIPVHKSDTLTLTMSKGTGSDRTYKYLHYVVRNATRKTFSEKLPHGLTLKQLKQFGYWWIQLAERTGNARPLHLGDLIDVRADHLERLRQDPKFAEAVSIPMVNVARVFKTGPSGRELPGPVSAPLAGARPSRWDVMPDGMSSAAPSRSLAPSPGVFASTGLPCAGVPAVSDQEERPTDEADPEELPSVDALVATFLSETHQSLTPVSVASGSTPATMEYPRKVVLTELQHRDRAQRQADKAAGKPVAKGPGSKLNIEAEKSSGGTDMACGVTSVAHIAIAPAAVAEAQAIGRAAPEFTQYVIKPMDDSGEMFGYRPLAVGDNINVLYMLHNPLTESSMENEAFQRAYAIRQLERAWKKWHIDATAVGVAISELNPLVAATNPLDSRLPKYDSICFNAMSAAVAYEPKAIIAFGTYSRDRWLRDYQKLPLQQAELHTSADDGMQHLVLTTASGAQVKVLFCPHPSMTYHFPEVLSSVATAHGVQFQQQQVESYAAKSYSFIRSVEKVNQRTEYVAVTVDAESRRFVLSDGALTHNCESWAVDVIFPEWQVMNQFINEVYGLAQNLDSLESSHPIELEVSTPEEINEIFDPINYNKGASLIRMLIQTIGHDAFRAGLQIYLREFAYKNASSQDLWRCMTQAAAAASKREGLEINVETVMGKWVKDLGYPLITVEESPAPHGKTACRCFAVSQKQFLQNGKSTAVVPAAGAASEELVKSGGEFWQVPLAIGAYSLQQVQQVFVAQRVLDKLSSVIEVYQQISAQPGTDTQLVHSFNHQSTGFYRVLYAPEMFDALSALIKKNILPTLDRLALLRDCYSLSICGQGYSMANLLDLLVLFENERDFTCIQFVSIVLSNLCGLHAEQSYAPQLQKLVVKLFGQRWKELGWGDSNSSSSSAAAAEGHLTYLERAILLQMLGLYSGDASIQTKAWVLLQAFAKNPTAKPSVIQPDLRGPVYCLALKHAGKEARTLLQQLYTTVSSSEEKVRILSALGTTRGLPSDDTAGEVQELLDWIFKSGLVRNGDLIYALTAVGQDSKQSRTICWEYIKANWEDLLSRFKGAMFVLGRIFPAIIGEMSTLRDAEEFEAFFSTHPAVGAERSVKQSSEAVRIKAARLQREIPIIREWLEKHPL